MSFIRLGKVQGMSPEEIRAVLGEGDPTVIFSLKEGTGSVKPVGEFDFENYTVLLNSGYTMPIMGLGTYALDHDTCVNSVKTLLQNGGRGHTAELLGDETIRSIAKAHSVSSAQVILRWDLQWGIVVIPGSSNPEHIKENLDLFGFELSDEEMAAISALDRDENMTGTEENAANLAVNLKN